MLVDGNEDEKRGQRQFSHSIVKGKGILLFYTRNIKSTVAARYVE